MKTKLVIDEDLKEYLVEEINLSEEESYIEFCKNHNEENFYYQWLFKFDNGLGASVVKHYSSYGYKDDLFEVMTIWWFDEGWLQYDSYVKGWLSNEDVMNLLNEIKNIKEIKDIQREGEEETNGN